MAYLSGNSLNRDFGFFSLLKFALPSVIMMMVMSMYSVVDSIFVSRFVGTNALSAINVVYPVINLLIGLGVMLASGGSAVIAAKLGAGKKEEARRDLSLIVVVGVAASVLLSILGLIFLKPLVSFLGASDLLMDYAVSYLGVILMFAPANMLQMLFQMFFVTAGKPGLGLTFIVGAGLVNAVLDFVFIVPLSMGIAGAALATGIGYLIPAVAGIIFFFKKDKDLHFVKPKFSGRTIGSSCSNGSSEMVSNLSMAIVTLVFNKLMLSFAGEDGVAAVTIVMYVQFLLTSVFMGFSLGVQPVISFHHGAMNQQNLKGIFKHSLVFILIASIAVFATAMIFGPTLTTIFTPKDTNVWALTVRGFMILPFCFLIEGFSIYASAAFTALGDGKTSALISFLRTFVFILAGLLTIPQFLGIDGIWLTVPIAELLSVIVVAVCVVWHKSRGRLKQVFEKNSTLKAYTL